MGFQFRSSTARAAWAAATTQQAQLEGLRDEWAGQMSVRYYSAADAHLVTVTHETPIVDTSTTPYSLKLGAYVAQTDYSVGVAAYCVLAVPAGADIARADCSLAGPGGAVTNPGGRVRTDIGTTLRVQATASLPAADTPAWRAAMVAEDTLYYVTGASNAGSPSGAPDLGTLPTHFGDSASSTPGSVGTGGWDVMSGYSSGTLMESEGGAHGTMVFGTGGHTRLQNQMLGLDLNVDSPVFDWWQQPDWDTSAASGAEIYYNATEYAALASTHKMVGEDPDSVGWPGTFPVGFDNWIIPGKFVTGQMGSGAPHGFRFSSVAYVPASVTGGAPTMFAHLGAQGPFAQSWRPRPSPDTTSDSEWVDASALVSIGGTDTRRFPFHTKNLTTGAWTAHQWRPAIAPYTFGGLMSRCFPDLSRVYSVGVATNAAGSTALGYWYAEWTAGTPAASAWIIPTGNNGGTSFASGEYACGAWTVGHPDGLHMVFLPDTNFSQRLIVIDFDTDTIARVDLASAGLGALPSNSDYIGMSYDATNNRVLILLKDSGTHALSYYSIGLPADPMSATGYTVALRSVSTSVGGMPLSDAAAFYGKTYLHPTLNCILVPTTKNRCMGFVPSA